MMSNISGVGAGSAAISSIDILKKTLDSQVDLAERSMKVMAEQEAVVAKLDTIGTVIDMYA